MNNAVRQYLTSDMESEDKTMTTTDKQAIIELQREADRLEALLVYIYFNTRSERSLVWLTQAIRQNAPEALRAVSVIESQGRRGRL